MTEAQGGDNFNFFNARGDRYVPPSLELKSFSCPHCGAFSFQLKYASYKRVLENTVHKYYPDDRFMTTKCLSCHREAIWVNDRLVVPPVSLAPPSHPLLPEPCRADYDEARAIVGLSPRGAAALLRLVVEKLCKELGAKGDNLNAMIGDLVAKGLPRRVQQALDAVRVIGNEQVHPGVLDLRDDPQTAATLFSLINFIVDRMIAEEQEIQAIYDSLPPSKREQIERRDGANSDASGG